MGRWFDPHWYAYLWSVTKYELWGRLSTEARLGIATITLVLIGFGGFLTFDQLNNTTSPAAARYVQLVTTVQKLVRVREQGHVVTRRVPVVRTVRRKVKVTVLTTRTRTLPGGTVVVTHPVVHYRRQVVQVNGKPVTVKQAVTDTVVVAKTKTATKPVTITTEHSTTSVVTTAKTATSTVNQVSTVTQSKTVTQSDTSTVTETDTVTTPVTVTETDTVTRPVTTTVTETQTVTEPTTVTVTTSADTTGG